MSPVLEALGRSSPFFLDEGGLAPEVDPRPARIVSHAHASVYDDFWKNLTQFPDESLLGSCSRALWMMGGFSCCLIFDALRPDGREGQGGGDAGSLDSQVFCHTNSVHVCGVWKNTSSLVSRPHHHHHLLLPPPTPSHAPSSQPPLTLQHPLLTPLPSNSVDRTFGDLFSTISKVFYFSSSSNVSPPQHRSLRFYGFSMFASFLDFSISCWSLVPCIFRFILVCFVFSPPMDVPVCVCVCGCLSAHVIGDFEMPDSGTIMEKCKLRLVATRTCRSFVKPGLWKSLGIPCICKCFFK